MRGFFCGVPDSLLKSFCAYVDDHCRTGEHIITANEGNAVALAAGHYLATGHIGVVYMQNSGLGNAVNPLASLADPEVFGIPMLMIVGWRGEPGTGDEPQHAKQGRITAEQLRLLEISHWIMDAAGDPDAVLDEAFSALHGTDAPVAILIRRGTFAHYESRRRSDPATGPTREEVLRRLLELAHPQDLVISTTGKTSRELFELRRERGEPQRDFLTVGSMGHTASIALGMALGQPGRRVLCLDGDGSVLMHLGAVPIIGHLKPPNLVHVLLNNAAHESVGGQPTVAGQLDFAAIAAGCGYQHYYRADTPAALSECWERIRHQSGPFLVEIRLRTGSRRDLGRPTNTPSQNKRNFIAHVRCEAS